MPAESSSTNRIGWIGTGVMGRSMCQHLINAGYSATVHSRTKEKARPLLDMGARWADTPADVARDAEIVFTMVGFPDDVRDIYLGANGIMEGLDEGKILVDMTTSNPSLATVLDERARAKTCRAVDAPVSGGDVGARNAALSIMVGGSQDAVNAIMPLLEVMGKTIVHQGPAGSGQHAKMCNQIVIAGTMVGVCESLIYGFRAGLDLKTLLASIGGGAAGCWTLDNLAPRILRRNFDPGFFVEHFIKDMGIALEEARRMNLALPGLALVQQLYLAVQANGGNRLGTQALMLALEQMNNIQLT